MGSRHRNAELWGPDVNHFNPHRSFRPEELMRVGSAKAAMNPQSERFSPFAHDPRSCLGKNFAQMEMRLIVAYLIRRYTFPLGKPYDQLKGVLSGPTISDPKEFRGVNNGTMGPMDMEGRLKTSWGQFYSYGMK